MSSHSSSKSAKSKTSSNSSHFKYKRPICSDKYRGKTRKSKSEIPLEDRKVILFNKPYDTLSQFTDDQDRKTLADYIPIKGVYAAGRLDRDSEGLMLLTNDGKLQAKITQPKSALPKKYWVQVEGQPKAEELDKLRQGVELKDGMTLPAIIDVIEEPNIWKRNPPIRFRASIPTTWLSVTITEGRNRQVRRMTASIGYPTLRLIRYSMGGETLGELQPGDYKLISTILT